VFQFDSAYSQFFGLKGLVPPRVQRVTGTVGTSADVCCSSEAGALCLWLPHHVYCATVPYCLTPRRPQIVGLGAGEAFGIARTSAGVVWTWGAGNNGQLCHSAGSLTGLKAGQVPRANWQNACGSEDAGTYLSISECGDEGEDCAGARVGAPRLEPSVQGPRLKSTPVLAGM
jgi:hypothetical protein